MPKPSGASDEMVRGPSAGFLAKVAVPTAVLHGREDRVVPLQAGLFASTHIARADLHVYSRSGHWVQLERREEFIHDVTALAERCP